MFNNWKQQTERAALIDVEKQSKIIQQKARTLAREAGKLNLPAPEANEPCENERAIYGEVHQLKSQFDEHYTEKLTQICTEQTEMISKLVGEELDECPAIARQLFETHKASFRGPLRDAAETEDQAYREHKATEDQFGKVNISMVGSYLLHVVAVIASLLVESVLNAFVFAPANPLGLLGGIFEAFAIAALSIAMSFTWGVVLGRVWSRGWASRALGIIGSAVFVAALLAYHCLVAWYRTILVHGETPADAVTQAVGFFNQFGFHLNDVHAWYLLTVGVFFGLLACSAGYRTRQAKIAASNARIIRNHEAAIEAFRSVREDFIQGVDHVHDEALRETELRLDDAKQAAHALRSHITEAKRLQRANSTTIEGLNELHESAIKTFRMVAGYIRTISEPRYWQQNIKPLDEGVKLDMASVHEAEALLGQLGQHLKALSDKALDIKETIRQAHRTHLSQAPAFIDSFRQRAARANDNPRDAQLHVLRLGAQELESNHG